MLVTSLVQNYTVLYMRKIILEVNGPVKTNIKKVACFWFHLQSLNVSDDIRMKSMTKTPPQNWPFLHSQISPEQTFNRRWEPVCPSTSHTHSERVWNMIAKCICFYSSWDQTCNPRCLPGLDLPVDSLFLGWGGFRGGGGAEGGRKNIKGTGKPYWD